MSEQKWISVKDKLPEPYQYVLAYYSGGRIRISMVFHVGRFCLQGVYGEVTHWMPLPAPPKEV